MYLPRKYNIPVTFTCQEGYFYCLHSWERTVFITYVWTTQPGFVDIIDFVWAILHAEQTVNIRRHQPKYKTVCPEIHPGTGLTL